MEQTLPPKGQQHSSQNILGEFARRIIPITTLCYFLSTPGCFVVSAFNPSVNNYRYDNSIAHGKIHRHHNFQFNMQNTNSGVSKEDSQNAITLSQYLKENNVEQELSSVLLHAAGSCVKISQQLTNLPITSFLQRNNNNDESNKNQQGGKINVQGETQKPMDVIANEIFIKSLQNHVGALASEEEKEIIYGKSNNNSNNAKYEVAFDPLDGSSNLDVSVPTGTIFGIAPFTPDKPFSSSGRKLVAAGYAVYSSSLELVISLEGTSKGLNESFAAGFTLSTPELFQSITGRQVEHDAERFLLSRPNIKIPRRGSYYSLNDGREPDWPSGLRRWIHDAKRGQTPSGTLYSSRYICSLCADFHRTLIKGGWAGNPRPHLRLLYEAAPLAHIAEACGGRGSDGVVSLLDIEPTGLHDRTCVFIGSMEDIIELEAYGDVQQSAKTYSA